MTVVSDDHDTIDEHDGHRPHEQPPHRAEQPTLAFLAALRARRRYVDGRAHDHG
jgi:hypothetical protein